MPTVCEAVLPRRPIEQRGCHVSAQISAMDLSLFIVSIYEMVTWSDLVRMKN
jgi:hypothetical protein